MKEEEDGRGGGARDLREIAVGKRGDRAVGSRQVRACRGRRGCRTAERLKASPLGACAEMGALFSKKKKYWVPEHRKLEDKIEDLSKWKVVEDMTGWQVQNSADKIGEAMAKSKATAEVNLSYNGLGDDECEAIANAIKQTKTIKRIILANNHIHETGAEVRSSLTSPLMLPYTSALLCSVQPLACSNERALPCAS